MSPFPPPRHVSHPGRIKFAISIVTVLVAGLALLVWSVQ